MAANVSVDPKVQRLTLHQALSYLAGLDPDRAGELNGVGFAGCDTGIGHALAESDPTIWTARQTYAAYRVARRYKNTQLGFIDFDAIGEPEKPAVAEARERQAKGPVASRPSLPPRRDPVQLPVSKIGFADSLFTIAWAYGDPDFERKKFIVKSASGARWNPDLKLWTVPVTPSAVEAVIALATEYALADSPFEVSDLAAVAIDEAVARFQDNVRGSHAKDADFEVNGLREGLSLYPFQRAGVAFITKNKRVIVGDEMGLGKTPEAIATIVHNGAFPALLITPSSLKLNWKRESERWIAPGAKPLRIVIASGTDAEGIVIGPDVDIVIANYDILGNYDGQAKRWIGRKTKKGEGSKGWGPVLCETKFQAIVCDEAHALKSHKAQRTKAVRELVRAINPEYVMMLTGTPFLNRPIEGWQLIDLIGHGYKTFGGWRKYVDRYCGASTGWGGSMDVSGASNLAELNERMRSAGAMIRRKKLDVLTELPARSWATVPMEMSKSGERAYGDAEANLSGFMAAKKAESAAKLTEWTDAYDAVVDGDFDAYIADCKRKFNASESARLSQSEELLRWEALKQAAYDAKRDAVFSWIDTFLESGEKLIVFGNHRSAVQEIAARYSAPTIMGGQKNEDIEAGKNRFMTDPNCNVIVCNIKAGGVGHTLTAASNVAFVELAWTPADMDQALDRAHRIGQTENVTGWILAAQFADGADTIDGELAAIISEKRTIVEKASDGDGEIAQVKTFELLRQRLEAKRNSR